MEPKFKTRKFHTMVLFPYLFLGMGGVDFLVSRVLFGIAQAHELFLLLTVSL